MLIDIVSKNGNLLINIEPDAGGNSPAIQLSRLKDFRKWMQVNSEGIYDTHPRKKQPVPCKIAPLSGLRKSNITSMFIYYKSP